MPRWWAMLWPAPITLFGAALAVIIRASGGRYERHGLAWEASGGIAPRLLWLMNPWASIEAITLGHIILARDALTASHLRAHEQVHVRQYERWGLLFPLAYVAASAIAVLKGGDTYRDNVFEREAFGVQFAQNVREKR